MCQIGVRNSIVLASFSSNFLAMVHVRWNDNSLTSTVLKHWLIKLTVDPIIKSGCYRFLVKQMGVVTAHMIVDSMNTGSYMYICNTCSNSNFLWLFSYMLWYVRGRCHRIRVGVRGDIFLCYLCICTIELIILFIYNNIDISTVISSGNRL